MNKSLFLFVFAFVAVLNLNASTDKTIHFSLPSMSVTSVSMNVEYGNVIFYETKNDSLIVDVRIVMDNIAENKATKELVNYNVVHHIKDGVLNLHQTRGNVTNTVRKYRFNYRIGVPKFYPLSIQSLFSSIDIPIWHEKIDIDATYSHLKFHNLVGKKKEGTLKLKSTDVVADTLMIGSVLLDQGSISANVIHESSIKASYAKVNIDDCLQMSMTGVSSQWNLRKAKNTKFNTKYALVKIDEVAGDVYVTNSFAPVYIRSINEDSATLNVKLDKGDLYLGVNFDIFNYVYVSLDNAALDNDIDKTDFIRRKGLGKDIFEMSNPGASTSKVYVDLRYGTMYNQ
ncbi:hypothetical protein OAT16_11690 [Prolixibacteraceae bacterium]|nr:hypothetical protein [Prolixibacteraceae bacterium]